MQVFLAKLLLAVMAISSPTSNVRAGGEILRPVVGAAKRFRPRPVSANPSVLSRSRPARAKTLKEMVGGKRSSRPVVRNSVADSQLVKSSRGSMELLGFTDDAQLAASFANRARPASRAFDDYYQALQLHASKLEGMSQQSAILGLEEVGLSARQALSAGRKMGSRFWGRIHERLLSCRLDPTAYSSESIRRVQNYFANIMLIGGGLAVGGGYWLTYKGRYNDNIMVNLGFDVVFSLVTSYFLMRILRPRAGGDPTTALGKLFRSKLEHSQLLPRVMYRSGFMYGFGATLGVPNALLYDALLGAEKRAKGKVESLLESEDSEEEINQFFRELDQLVPEEDLDAMLVDLRGEFPDFFVGDSSNASIDQLRLNSSLDLRDPDTRAAAEKLIEEKLYVELGGGPWNTSGSLGWDKYKHARTWEAGTLPATIAIQMGIASIFCTNAGVARPVLALFKASAAFLAFRVVNDWLFYGTKKMTIGPRHDLESAPAE